MYWGELYQDLYDISNEKHINPNWSEHLVRAALELYKGIWDDQNKCLYGNSRKESQQKLRDRILQHVNKLYKHPPSLLRWYPAISSISFQERSRRSTTHLHRWLHRINHQILVTKHVFRLTWTTDVMAGIWYVVWWGPSIKEVPPMNDLLHEYSNWGTPLLTNVVNQNDAKRCIARLRVISFSYYYYYY
jgi:hypothetical protein